MKHGFIIAMALVLLPSCEKGADDRQSAAPARPVEAKMSNAKAGLTKPPSIALDDLIRFTKPSECEKEGAAGKSINDLLIYGDGQPIRLGRLNVPKIYRAAFGELKMSRDGEYAVAILPITAAWHGLHLVEYREAMGETDAWYEEFSFAESFGQVRTTLNKLGFQIEADGSQKPPPFSEGARVELDRHGKGSKLVCWF